MVQGYPGVRLGFRARRLLLGDGTIMETSIIRDLNNVSELETPTGLRVLVVDDNRDQAAMLAMLVERWRHTVKVAHSATEAVQVAETYRPRVVLLDLGLPDRHGYDLADMLRHQADRRKIYFVAVTGWTQIADQIRSSSSGINHHLIKPVNNDVLREILMAYATTNEKAEIPSWPGLT